LAYILPWTVSVDLHPKFFWQPLKKTISFLQVAFRLFKGVQGHNFTANRKRMYDFILVSNSNLVPISHRFGDIAGFLCSWPHPFNPNFGGVPVAPGGPCWVSPTARP